jgi:hypothetical protein
MLVHLYANLYILTPGIFVISALAYNVASEMEWKLQS